LSAFAVHFALRGEATFHSHSGPVRSAAGGLGTTEGLRRQMQAAAEGRVETESPWLLLMATTTVDPDRAPDGGGIFKMLTVAPELLDGRPWTEADGLSFAQHLLNFSRAHVDGLEDDDILAMRVETPTSLAAHNLSNLGGSCHGGEFVMDDGSATRGWPDYRCDVPGLYLTGSTSHPGGSVTGRPGRNTARVILDDLGIGAEKVMSTP
jgi:phytoene dehydrogenase-like protein